MGLKKVLLIGGVGYYLGTLDLRQRYRTVRDQMMEEAKADPHLDTEKTSDRRIIAGTAVLMTASAPLLIPIHFIAARLGHPDQPDAFVQGLGNKVAEQFGVWGLRLSMKDYENKRKQDPNAEGVD